jgi:glucose-6-phosphate isomerase
MLSFNDNNNFIATIDSQYDFKTLNELIDNKSIIGSKEWTGWFDDLKKADYQNVDIYKDKAKHLQKHAKTMLVIGIGGSYLGTKAVYESIAKNCEYELIFAGINLDSDYINQLKEYLQNRDFVITYISKSGTTLEPAIVFRIFKNLLIDKYGIDCLSSKVVIITSQNNELSKFASKHNITRYILADNIGGRYSIFTAVGLLALSFVDIQIDQLLKGAYDAYDLNKQLKDESIAFRYAKNRFSLYQNNHSIEAFVIYNSRLDYLLEWCKQLFAESEGKNNLGLFPVSLNFTRDLHSIGQMIQEGSRIIDGHRIFFETIIKVEKADTTIILNKEVDDFDNLNRLDNMSLNQINNLTLKAVEKAHNDGGVATLLFTMDRIDEYNLGSFMANLMIACMYSAYMLGVNPFDQNGVEAYKKEITKILEEER